MQGTPAPPSRQALARFDKAHGGGEIALIVAYFPPSRPAARRAETFEWGVIAEAYGRRCMLGISHEGAMPAV